LGVTRIAVVGDRLVGSEPQDTIEPAVAHASAALGGQCDVVWVPTPDLLDDADAVLDAADAVWCAPGSPFVSLEGALAGIRWARERRVPFLGTCAGFQHAVIEFARNVLGVAEAHHGEYEHADRDPLTSDLFIHELLCSLVGQTMTVHLVDDVVRAIYGAGDVTERYYCRFGLNPLHRPALEDAGLRVAGVDQADGDVRILRLADHRFFVATLFVPQTASTLARPHPLVTAFVRAASQFGAQTRR
jgi:CTP synthase (UTP-ammonia lyase)